MRYVVGTSYGLSDNWWVDSELFEDGYLSIFTLML